MYISGYFPYRPTFGLLPFWDLNKTQGLCHKRLDFRFAKMVPVTIHKSLQFFVNLMLSFQIRNSILIVSIFAFPFPPNFKFFLVRKNCSKNLGTNIKAPFTHLKVTRNSDKNHHINNVTKTSLSKCPYSVTHSIWVWLCQERKTSLELTALVTKHLTTPSRKIDHKLTLFLL